MASTSPGYGITIRVEGSPDSNPVALATTVITGAGATITALDVVESLLEKVVIDITCDTIDSDHADQITVVASATGCESGEPSTRIVIPYPGEVDAI